MNCSCSAAIDKQRIDKEVKHKALCKIEAARLVGSTSATSFSMSAATPFLIGYQLDVRG